MDNPLSTPQLKLPTVPSDFNGGVGVDFARALMRLLEGATLAGGTQDSSQPFDVAALQQDVENLTTALNNSKRKMRTITMSGVDDGQITVPFPDIGTVNYDVNSSVIIPDGVNPTPVGIYPIAGSYQTSQFKARVDGSGAAYQIKFVVIEIKDGGV